MDLVKRFFATQNDGVITFLRVAMGAIMLPHGAQKLFGWFGGPGFEPIMGVFTGMGIPYWLGVMVVLVEVFASLALILGAFTRLSAALIIANMIGAMALVNLANGFFWTDGGVEFHLLIIAVCAALVIRGAGALGVDAWIAERIGQARTQSETLAPAGGK